MERFVLDSLSCFHFLFSFLVFLIVDSCVFFVLCSLSLVLCIFTTCSDNSFILIGRPDILCFFFDYFPFILNWVSVVLKNQTIFHVGF